MRFHFILLFLLILSIACAPSKKPLPFLPPGVELGATWEEAEDYGYTEDVFVTPEYLAYPLKGSRNLLQAMHKTYADKNNCPENSEKATLQYVVSETGEIEGLYPITQIGDSCASLLFETLHSFEFFPSEHKGKSVKTLMAITVTDQRLW